jgi:hypothetical protein
VFVHVALASQLSVPAVHSSSSAQVTPSPVYPALHAHVNEPGVFVHVALTSQLSDAVAHSSISVQVIVVSEHV